MSSEPEHKKSLPGASPQPGPSSPGRRRLFQALGISAGFLPKSWGRPLVQTVLVPAFASNSMGVSVSPTPSASQPAPSVSVSPTPTPTPTATATPTPTPTQTNTPTPT